MFKTLFNFAVNRFARADRPGIDQLAGYVLLEPTAKQVELARAGEFALSAMVSSVMNLDEKAAIIEAHGVKLNIDAELRSIIGKMYAARKRIARRAFVQTEID